VFSQRTTGGSSVVLDGRALAVESVVGSTGHLATNESLAEDGRAQLLGGEACGEHVCGCEYRKGVVSQSV
jgi:hypothetical protein